MALSHKRPPLLVVLLLLRMLHFLCLAALVLLPAVVIDLRNVIVQLVGLCCAMLLVLLANQLMVLLDGICYADAQCKELLAQLKLSVLQCQLIGIGCSSVNKTCAKQAYMLVPACARATRGLQQV